MKKFIQILLALFVIFYIIGVISESDKQFTITEEGTPGWSSKSENTFTPIPLNSSSYFALDNEIGCSSTYNEQKIDDIFEAKYKDHWMVMSGEINIVDGGRVSLNTDGKGTQDIVVEFNDESVAYDLEIGQRITVGFIMKSTGGCFLPFGGKHAVLVR